MQRLSSQYDGEQIEIDLRDLTFIDLRGVDALRQAARTIGSSGRMTLIGGPRLLDLLLDATGTADSFDRRD